MEKVYIWATLGESIYDYKHLPNRNFFVRTAFGVKNGEQVKGSLSGARADLRRRLLP